MSLLLLLYAIISVMVFRVTYLLFVEIYEVEKIWNLLNGQNSKRTLYDLTILMAQKKLQKGEPNALVTWNQKVPMLYKFQDNGKTWLSIIKCFVVEVFDLCHWGFHKIVLILNYVYNYKYKKSKLFNLRSNGS